MSVSQRTLARLPSELFAVHHDDANSTELQQAICKKLKSFPRKSRGGLFYDNVKTVGGLLQLSMPTLMRALDPLLTYGECRELVRRIGVHCLPTHTTAFAMLEQQQQQQLHIPTSLRELDRHLRGGIRVGTITEVVGKAGVGKTQLAMQLCVEAARLGQGSIYIDTEKKMSQERIKEIALQRSTCDNVSLSDPPYRACHDVLANVSLHTPSNLEELFKALRGTEDEMLTRNEAAEDPYHQDSRFPVRLLIVDSIAAPMRREFGAGSAPQCAAAVIQCSQILKRLADQYNLAILAINQVGTSILADATTKPGRTAALGTAWHHCVATVVEVSSFQNENDRSSRGLKRAMSVVKSNTTATSGQIPFVVTSLGICESPTLEE